MSIIHPHRHIRDGALSTSGTQYFSPIDCRTLVARRLSFTMEWTGVASTDGDLFVQVSDDPRVADDILRGTTTAKWITRTIPDGSNDGSQYSLSGKLITINANAGDMHLNLTDVPAWVRLGYTRRAAGGVLQAYVSGD